MCEVKDRIIGKLQSSS